MKYEYAVLTTWNEKKITFSDKDKGQEYTHFFKLFSST